MSASLHLGVNVDHVATLRQVRGVTYPSPSEAAALCVAAGAEGITVHLREDRRHIQEHDVRSLKRDLSVPLNLEMANAPEILAIALDVLPAEACLVPEKREELTTEGGLDAAGLREQLRPAVDALKAAGVEVSLFIEPEQAQLDAAAALGASCVELHTGTYCEAEPEAAKAELERLVRAARRAHAMGLTVNAGHGIHLGNLPGILEIPHLHTLNIGHSIVARAVMVGLEQAVLDFRSAMAAYQGGER
jgi:pyridoxine 5-phosphate synthase